MAIPNSNISPDKSQESSNRLFYILLSILIPTIVIFSFLMVDLVRKDLSKPPKPIPKTPKEKEKILSGMVGKNSKDNLPYILKSAVSESPKQRMLSLRALQYYGVSQAHNIQRFLADQDPQLRKAATQILGNLRYLPSLSAILKLAKDSPKPGDKLICLGALAKICQNRVRLAVSRPALEYLVELIADKNPALSRYADMTLKQISQHKNYNPNPTTKELQRFWRRWMDRVCPKK